MAFLSQIKYFFLGVLAAFCKIKECLANAAETPPGLTGALDNGNNVRTYEYGY